MQTTSSTLSIIDIHANSFGTLLESRPGILSGASDLEFAACQNEVLMATIESLLPLVEDFLAIVG